MDIEYLGELKESGPFDGVWLSSEVEIPYFGGKKFFFELELQDNLLDEDFLSAIRNFFHLTEKDKSEAKQYLFENYQECVGYWSEDDVSIVKIENEQQVWDFLHPDKIGLFRGDNSVYVVIFAECDWDSEHGLQIVYREGKTLTGVGEQGSPLD